MEHVEQNTQEITQAGETSGEEAVDERDELIRAAEEHQAGEGEPGTEPKPKEAKPKVEAKEEEESLPKLAAILRAREQAQKMRDDGEKDRQEAARIKAEAEQAKAEYQKLIEEAQSHRAQLEMLKKDPMRAIREIGWEPQDLVNSVIREGTAEWQALSKQEQLIESQKAELQQVRDALKQLVERDQYREQKVQQDYEKYRRENTINMFLGEHASSDRCPNLHLLYEPEEIVAKGDKIADEFQNRTGQVASLSDIAEYLESEAAKRVALFRQKQAGSGNASKQRAMGPRTLSASSVSERRAMPKPIREMSPEEEREALIAAAKEAARESA